MGQDAGWTLREAIRRTVDTDLLRHCISAERDWRRAGAPTRIVRSFGLDRDAEAGDQGQKNRQARVLRNTQLSAAHSVAEAFRAHLISGQLVARGRRGSPLAEIVFIPASAWKLLTFKNFRRSVVTEPAPNKTAIYDVRIVPALWADNIVYQLDNEPLLRAFDSFVFNDPQVARLRKLAVEGGGEPSTIGFQSRLYQAYWKVDHGIQPIDDPFGFFMDVDDRPFCRSTEVVLRDRFRRIVQLLIDGVIVAEGALNGQGAIVTISRAMWLRKGAVLDLYKGDFYHRYPDPGGDGEKRVPPLYLSLMLRRPRAESTEKLHVKPTEHDNARSSTATFVMETSRKGALGAVARERAQLSCREWLAGLMRESPKKRTHTNDQLWTIAQKNWPGISERSFATARKLAMADTGAHLWGVAGATQKSPQTNRRGE